MTTMNEGLSGEDLGTLCMLLLCFILTCAVVVYFTCAYYRKKKRNTNDNVEERKVKVNKTFSRFSQVDEELTVHMADELDERDRQLVLSSSLSSMQGSPRLQTTRSKSRSKHAASKGIALATDVEKTSSNSHTLTTFDQKDKEQRPYLETDM